MLGTTLKIMTAQPSAILFLKCMNETVLIQQGNIHNNIMLLLLKSVLIIIIIVHYLGGCQIHYCLHL